MYVATLVLEKMIKIATLCSLTYYKPKMNPYLQKLEIYNVTLNDNYN